MNNEPYDDLLAPSGRRADLVDFARAWAVEDPEGCGTTTTAAAAATAGAAAEDVRALCEAIFGGKVSPFAACFSRVAGQPFLAACLESSSEEETCTVVVSYMNLCSYEDVPLRIPDFCVK